MTFWSEQLIDQFDFHWRHQLQPRLAGLGDEEYLWEPVPGAWNVRPRGTSTAPIAAEAMAQLDNELDRRRAGVSGWDDDQLHLPCGPAEGPYAEAPRAALVLHIHRELIHHLAEVSPLRDLYAHTHQES